MRFLVTGGNGFIGTNFIRRCLYQVPDASVLNIDCLTYAGNLSNMVEFQHDKRYKHLKVDVCDVLQHKDEILEFKPDVIVHFAAESHVDRSLKDGGAFIRTNVQGTLAMLELCRLVKPVKFCQVGTDEVYGSLYPEDAPSKETDILKPRSPYSASKAAADLLALAYLNTYGPAECPVVITRSSNNYGPYQHPEKALPLMITNWLDGEPFPLYGVGNNVREWIYVQDNVQGILHVINNGIIGNIYNLGSNHHLTNLELIDAVSNAMDIEPDIVHVADRLGHDLRYSLDIGKILQLGWMPRVQFADGIQFTIGWYAEHRAWWEPLKYANQAHV